MSNADGASSSSSSQTNILSSAKIEIDANLSILLLHDIDLVEKSFEAVKQKAREVIAQMKEARNKFETLMLLPGGKGWRRHSQLQELKTKVSKLKSIIPYNLIAPLDPPNPNINQRPRSDTRHANKGLASSSGGGDSGGLGLAGGSFPPTYHELESGIRNSNLIELKCLWCFLTFPEETLIKRSILFWWVKIYRFPEIYDPNKAMEGLIEKALVHKVVKKCSETVSGYWMPPFVHSTLKLKSRAWFPGRITEMSEWYLSHSLDDEEEVDVYYSIESFLPILSSKTFKILYLGRWMKAAQHIEVIDAESFFKVLFSKSIDKFRSLEIVSLRGISMIEELPKFITELTKLRVLDLKACYNLEVIPSDIKRLRHTLTHLDVSECYLLDGMPKAIASLTRLQVLKGFVVGEYEDDETCTLEDLGALKELSKLNITARVKEFPTKIQLRTLESLVLRSLAISWGRCSNTKIHPSITSHASKQLLTSQEGKEQARDDTFSFRWLKKLDLQCVPETVHYWLQPSHFIGLKRLYIRGGQFCYLGQTPGKSHDWSVEILRLKHLSKLNLSWGELTYFFPKMVCLEVVNCRNLHGFPCDEDGVWAKGRWHNRYSSSH